MAFRISLEQYVSSLDPGYRVPQVLAKGSIVPNTGFMMVKGVVDFPDQIMEGAKVFAEVPVPNMAVTLDRFAVFDPANLSSLATLPANLTDTYQPCVLHPDNAPSAVYQISLPANTSSDTLSVELCSPGGYDQVPPRSPHSASALSHLSGPPLGVDPQALFFTFRPLRPPPSSTPCALPCFLASLFCASHVRRKEGRKEGGR